MTGIPSCNNVLSYTPTSLFQFNTPRVIILRMSDKCCRAIYSFNQSSWKVRPIHDVPRM